MFFSYHVEKCMCVCVCVRARTCVSIVQGFEECICCFLSSRLILWCSIWVTDVASVYQLLYMKKMRGETDDVFKARWDRARFRCGHSAFLSHLLSQFSVIFSKLKFNMFTRKSRGDIRQARNGKLFFYCWLKQSSVPSQNFSFGFKKTSRESWSSWSSKSTSNRNLTSVFLDSRENFILQIQ